MLTQRSPRQELQFLMTLAVATALTPLADWTVGRTSSLLKTKGENGEEKPQDAWNNKSRPHRLF